MQSDAHGKTSFLLKPLARALMSLRGAPAGFGLLLPALAMAQQLPTGGQVVAGSATITQPDGSTMVINQGSNKAIINWQGFSIGNGGYVQFIQPGSTSIALNRVVGQDPSSILGRLSANGQVFLVNPNGVYFGANATVDVAGIVASTMNIRNEDFMRGDYIFKRDPNAPGNATVINAGSINANGGYVVLAGDYVSNTGLIQANLGTAMLASGSAMTLQMAGSSLINYAIDEATLAHLAGVNNAGQIMASGGKIIMTAEVANQLAGTVVNNSGLIQAQGTVEKDGAIYLTGKGGDVVNAGTLDASGGQDGKAGQVHMRASGDLVHEAGSLITADGAKTGVSDGGSIDTWADGKNRFKEGATITARGGEEGGDGGFVELSGNSVAYRGDIDLLAKNGKGGTLLIDPKTITIKNGSGTNDEASDDATFYEANLESALSGAGNVVLVAQNSGQGNVASITMEDLADDVLNGTGTGGLTLKVEATDGATGSIKFDDVNDRIRVGGQLNLSVDNADGAGVGSITAGHLESRTGIDVMAGSISAQSMRIQRELSTNTDTSYTIKARAYTGDLNVAGNVAVEVVNDTAAAVSTEVNLKADNGKIDIGGNVLSNATGLGYHHYNWVTDYNGTAGNDATTYFGQQPWKMVNEGDHAIKTKLSIEAATDVKVAGSVMALATDTNTVFATKGVGGYFQTATATTHNFWRPTAASAEATITATGGDVNIIGTTAVKADGYATSSYSETESWRQMVDNFNYTSANQTVHTDYGCLSYTDQSCTGGMGYRDSYIHTVNNMKGSAKSGSEKYIWQFGEYTPSLPGSANGSANVPAAVVDSSTGTTTGPMSYTGAGGLTAKLDISAGKSVTLNSVDVRATNRSATGTSSYSDSNWGHQDTANGLSNTASSFTSANRETDYSDTISTQYQSASTDAQVNITAGEGSAINLNDSTFVVASHTDSSASNGKLDFASMTLTAGNGDGAQTSNININAPVLVDGSSDESINLTVLNRDGGIAQADYNAAIDVKNRYSAGDASASFTSDNTNVTLDAVTVTAGNAASLTAKAKDQLETTGNLSATATNTATVDVEATDGSLTMNGSVTASAASASIDLSSGTTLTANGALSSNGAGSAAIDIDAATDLEVNAAVTATASGGTGSASVDMTAGGALTANADIKAIATQSQTSGTYNNWFITGGNASVNLQSAGDMDLNQNVAANGYNSATMTVSSSAGKVDLAAGKSIASQATGTAYDTQYYHYSHSASLNLTGQTGMDINGNVSTSAAAGTATSTLKTLDGAGSDINQAAASTISTTGRAATQVIKAGNDQSDADNMADANLAGAITAIATQGDAKLQVEGANVGVKAFNAASSNGKAQATFSALKGNMTLSGPGIVSGNSNAVDGADLAVNVSGLLNAEEATLIVNNSSTGNAAGARAQITAGAADDDYNALGALSVSGYAAALASANVTGVLSVSGNVIANATGANGSAQATLASSEANLILHSDASLQANALSTGGNATTTLSAGIGMQVNGDVLAQAANQGTVTVKTTGGNTAGINQGADSEIKAAGNAATVNVNAGNASPTALNAADLNLDGTVKAVATTGNASLNLKGKAVTTKGLSATSQSGAAHLQAEALDGNLTMDGAITTTGSVAASGATLVLDSSGEMDLSSATITVNNSNDSADSTSSATLNAGGSLTLGSVEMGAGNSATFNATSTGNLRVTQVVSVQARGDNSTGGAFLTAQDGSIEVGVDQAVISGGANANTTLLATNGMQIDGEVSANATTGTAATSLTTTGGATADINQGSTGSIAAKGGTANVSILAGDAEPNAINAAAFSLQGNVAAEAGAGTGSVTIMGKSGGTHGLSATSQTGAATLTVGALDGALAIEGEVTVGGNTDNANGAVLNLSSTGALELSAANVAVSNSSDGTQSGASATIGSEDTLTLGAVLVSSGKTATLNATGKDLTVTATLGSVASRTDGMAVTSLRADGGSLTVDAGQSVGSLSAGSASTTLVASSGMQVDGTVNASATNGDASTSLTTTGGADAAINQGNDSTISAAAGMAATTSLLAGNAVPGLSNAAFDLNGLVEAKAGSGTATVDIRGKSGNTRDLSATSQTGGAALTVAALDGTLTINGDLTATGDVDSADGVALNLSSTGEMNLSAANITVDNASDGAQSGAEANVFSGETLNLGSVSVAAGKTATLNVTAETLTATADVDSNARDAMGAATTTLTADGGILTVNADQTVSSRSGGSASTNLVATNGIIVDGDVSANGGSFTGSTSLITTGGAEASINQTAASTISAAGKNATVNIKAGDANPGTSNSAEFDLAGTVTADATTGNSQVNIMGKSGTLNGLRAGSDHGEASLQVAALDGTLTALGEITVSGNTDDMMGARAGLQASGALDTSAASITVNNGDSGSQAGARIELASTDSSVTLGDVYVGSNQTASLNASSKGALNVNGDLQSYVNSGTGLASVALNAADGILTVSADKIVRSTGTGNASTSLIADNGIVLDGNVLASGTGEASVNLGTNGGALASIIQGSDSTIVADGGSASIQIAAGVGTPTESTGATYTLDGALSAQAGAGEATIVVVGQGGSVKDVTANSQDGNASLYVQAVAGNLDVSGDISVSGNANSNFGAALDMIASGAVDTTGGTITLNNLNQGNVAGATANLVAGTTMDLGPVDIGAATSSTLSATSEAELTVAADINSTAGALNGSSNITLTSNQAGVNLLADKTVTATGPASAVVNVIANQGVLIDGDITAAASDGLAIVDIHTTGGALAAINQGSASTISADGGITAVIGIRGGAEEPDEGTAASVNLAGLTKAHAANGLAQIEVESASASLNNLEAQADLGKATVGVNALDTDGMLTLNGNLTASGNMDDNEGATVYLQGAGSIDTTAGTIVVDNASSGQDAKASASIIAAGGDLNLGPVSVTGQNAELYAGALGDFTTDALIKVKGIDSANLKLGAAGDLKLQSDLEVEATEGAAVVNLMSSSPDMMTASTADTDDSDSNMPTGGDIIQSADTNLVITGATAHATINATNGRVTLGGNTRMEGALQTDMTVDAQSVEVKNLDMRSSDGRALAQMTSWDGNIVMNGEVQIAGAEDSNYGAGLQLSSQSAIDTRDATISVTNSAAGQDAGAILAMTTAAGNIQAGTVSASTDGGGTADISMLARGTLSLTGDVSAIATGNGTAAVQLRSGVENHVGFNSMVAMSPPVEPLILSGSITQSAGKLIKASSDTGDAKVELQTGNCCSGSINLAGAVESKVEGGEGMATIDMLSDNVTVNKLTANSGVSNTGGSAINVMATNSITVNGKLDLQAKNADANADMKLVADTLNWNGGAATLSNNNAHIQLAAFDPSRLIGVESDQDFDSVPRTNYSQTMLKNFMGYGAEITFGGEVDRSAFSHSNLQNLVQQAADIHVAGNGKLDLGDVKMVFDTTGTVYYHDPKMSPWSVPAGRIAIYVARPNVDRYLDRTDNTLQNMTRALENSVFGNNGTPTVNPGGAGPVPGTTQISGNLYMAGNGVNTSGDTGNAGNVGNAGNAGNAGTAAVNGGSDGGAGTAGANPGTPQGGDAPGNVDPTKREAGEQSQGAERKRDGEEDQAS